MKTTDLAIFFPYDPLGSKVGGAESFLKGFIKYAPDDFTIQFVGITSDQNNRAPKKWIRLKLGRRDFDFFPLFFVEDEDKRTRIPLSLRFTLALKNSKMDFSNKVLFFNRIEPEILFRRADVPKIAVVHNDIKRQVEKDKSEVLWSKIPFIYFMLEKFIFASLDRVYTVSKDTLEFYQLRYRNQKEKFSFIPTWVDIDLFYPVEEPKQGVKKRLKSLYEILPIEDSWILFVGRLQKQKAPERLIDSFREYHKKNRDVSLIIIGEGNLRNSVIEQIKKCGLENNVFVIGNMNQQRLADFYRASDVLLLTSHFEGMPICVLEALGCGLPVVSTDVGEVGRVIKTEFSGEISESFSPSLISRSLEKVLKNLHVYNKKNCLSAVSEYVPQKVLQPLYDSIQLLFRERCQISDGVSN